MGMGLRRGSDPPRVPSERQALYLITDLEEMGFTRRTIYYYVSIGLMQPAIGRGRTAYYTEEHAAALRLIREERDENRSLSDIRDLLSERARRTRRRRRT